MACRRLALVLVILSAMSSKVCDAAVSPEERAALIALYNSTNGPGWIGNAGWLGSQGTECSWSGVYCDYKGEIYRIYLDHNGLKGALPPQLGDLVHLQDLWIIGEALTGAIPPQLTALPDLRSLAITDSGLSGTVPAMLGSMPRLEELSLRGNQFSGSIPPELGNIATLRHIDLSGNPISGPIPASIGMLPNLEEVLISDTDIVGPLPSNFGGAGKLTYVDLSQNWRLAGAIPSSLTAQPNLLTLNLGWSSFDGGIPASIGLATRLTKLNVTTNHLDGTIPDGLGALTALKELWLSGNMFTGELPSSIKSLSALTFLDLKYNALYATDASVDAWLDAHQPGWSSTQTVAPTNLQVGQITSSSVALSWTSIEYTSGNGRYEVWSNSGSGWRFATSTSGKYASGITVSGLFSNTTYRFKVRAISDRHGLNPNSVASEFTPEVEARTAVSTTPPRLSVSDTRVSELEHSSSRALRFRVELSAASTSTVTVVYESVDGTATAGKDYVAIPPATLTFAPGVLSLDVPITVLHDRLDEPEEYFFLKLSNATNATIIDESGRCALEDVDVAHLGLYAFGGIVEASESAATLDFVVSMQSASSSVVQAKVAVTGGTAEAGVDYEAYPPTTLTFEPGESWKEVRLPIVHDTLDEDNETVTLSMTSLTGVPVIQATATITIIDDDGAPSLRVIDQRLGEGNSGEHTASIELKVDGSSEQAVSVSWATRDGSATSGTDYVGGEGTLTIPSGVGGVTIPITIKGDAEAEGPEWFSILLGAPLNAQIGDREAIITIVDDDATVEELPDPVIGVTGCTTIGAPCKLDARSRSGAAAEFWVFQWWMDGELRSTGPSWAPSISEPGTYVVRLVAVNTAGSAEAEVTLIVAPASIPCPSEALCLLESRFELSLAATDPRTGSIGGGVPLPRNDIFGYFAVPSLTGDPGNPEVFVKVLDGRAVNGSFWVFFGGLTDLGYVLEVKDRVAGSSRTYVKPAGSSGGGFDVGGGVASESCPDEVDGTALPGASAEPCAAGTAALCLNGARFRVELKARDQRTGSTGAGLAIPGNDIFGYFAVPDLTHEPENPEVFVKMLDGRGVNGFWWFFYGGLTDLEYTLTVTDTLTGQGRSYTKAAGSACGAFDVGAF